MGGYSKLFSSIVTSTIWCEDHATVRVWIAMLAMKNWDGIVEGSVPGFAHLAHVTVPEMEKALAVLMAADPHSRTPDNDGRRIEVVPGGWRVLNHDAYNFRDSADHRRELTAERVRRHRDRRAKDVTQDVTTRNESKPHTDLDTDTNKEEPKPSPASPVTRLQVFFAEKLKAHPGGGAEAKVNYAQLGKILKTRLATIPESDLWARIDNWFKSTDPWVVRNLNNVGVFDGRLHILNGGPIHGKTKEEPKNGFRSSGSHDTREPAGGRAGIPAAGGGGGVVL